MRIAVEAFVVAVIMGIVGILIDYNVGMDGNFSVVLAVATIGALVIYAIDRKK